MSGRLDEDLKGLSDKFDAKFDALNAKFDSSNRQAVNLTVALSIIAILFLIYMEVKGIVS